jgi:hypothetical protein
MEMLPPNLPTKSAKLQKYWMSPKADLLELGGVIHEQWARLFLNLDIAEPMPQDGGVNAKQLLLDQDWIRIAPASGLQGFSIELGLNKQLSQVQHARLLWLAEQAGAEFIVREANGKMQQIWHST